MRRNHQRLEAQPAYESAHLVAQDLVGRIQELLFDQPAPDSDQPIHWGHVGDMTEINRRLASVVEFLEGRNR